MATGIVSLALSLDGQTTLACILLAIAALEWIALALVVAILFARHPTSVLRRVRSPAALSAVTCPPGIRDATASATFRSPGIRFRGRSARPRRRSVRTESDRGRDGSSL